uniref:opsin-2-like isoform X1 n=1 Tax=Styela clava TaxID=7725 RepID=UPI001939D154|nr:opsin-2-like isoform X1 [Styela clava]
MATEEVGMESTLQDGGYERSSGLSETTTDWETAKTPQRNFYGSIAMTFLILGLISVVGNLLLVYTFCRRERLRKKAANLLTIHLAVNNAFLGVMALRIGVKMVLNLGAEDLISCQTEGFLLSTVHINIMLTIAAMFGDRYVVICKSGSEDSCLSMCHYRPSRVVILIWIHSAFWAFWPLTAVVPSYVEETLIPCCIFDRHNATLLNILYLVAMSLSSFVLPLMFVCFSMSRIFEEVKNSSELIRMRKGRRYLTQSRSVCSGTDASYTEGRDLPQQNSEKTKGATGSKASTTVFQRSATDVPSTIVEVTSQNMSEKALISRTKNYSYTPEKAVLRSAVILVATFSISWTPFCLVCFLNVAGIGVNYYLVVLSYLLAKASCVHSSYAYATHHHFKATIKYITCRACHGLLGL